MRWLSVVVLMVTVGFLAADDVSAQGLENEYERVATFNPIGIVFGMISVEGEQRMSETTSIGVAASLYSPTGYTYLSAEGKYRYYPQGEAMRGFSVGGGAGLTTVSASRALGGDSSFGLSVGIFLDYQHFMGDEERFALVGGLGGKRVFLFDDVAGVDLTYPTVRLGIGYAL